MRQQRAVYVLIVMMFNAQHLYSSEKREVEVNWPVNFAGAYYTCYFSVGMQAFIALPSWRSYIMNYPQNCATKTYDKSILANLQGLIQQYSSVPLNGVCNVKDFYTDLVKRGSKEKDFFAFFDDLNKAFLHYTRSIDDESLFSCGLLDLFSFTIRYPGLVTTRWWLNVNFISKTEQFYDQPSLNDLIMRELSGIDVSGKRFIRGKFVKIPKILLIDSNFIGPVEPSVGEIELNRRNGYPPPESFPGTLEDGRPYHIPQELDITMVVDSSLRSGEKIVYRLSSVLWQTHIITRMAHIIACVRYGDKWYMCDDYRSGSCEMVSDLDIKKHLLAGVIENRYGYKRLLPGILCYELIESEPGSEKLSILPDLHAALTLLGV